MEFDYNEYFKILFLGSVCIMAFSIIAIVVGTILFIKGNNFIKFDKRALGYFSSIIVLIFLFSLGFSPFRHGMHLIGEKETDKIVCVGEVNSFKKVYGNNKYVYNGENTFAYYIFIDEQKYYIMNTGDIEIGDKVEFEYLPKSRIVLSINKKQ